VNLLSFHNDIFILSCHLFPSNRLEFCLGTKGGWRRSAICEAKGLASFQLTTHVMIPTQRVVVGRLLTRTVLLRNRDNSHPFVRSARQNRSRLGLPQTSHAKIGTMKLALAGRRILRIDMPPQAESIDINDGISVTYNV
jgi:hypothetical protein